MILRRVWNKLRSQGLSSLASAALRRVFPAPARAFARLSPAFTGASGLEIGGPSGIFGRHGRFPVYGLPARLDNCNFAQYTLWEGEIEAGGTVDFAGRGARGQQFVAEATDLGMIPDGSYDFVLSSNTLEHVANPLRALREWLRVLREDGLIVLVLPHREGTFDHRRPVTPLAHLIEDEEFAMGEADLTHLDEILRLHDLRRDPEAGGRAAFEARARDNLANRSLHHHVFDTRRAFDLMDHLELEVLAIEAFRPYDILLVCRKPALPRQGLNDGIRADWKDVVRRSPFGSDPV